MRKLMILMMLALIPATFNSCRGHRGHNGEDGVNGTDGTDGTDGIDGIDGLDGSDGLNGIGFDYVRGISGAELCTGFLVIPAELVLPEAILNLAPPVDWHDPQGATLTFGDVNLSFRYYLAPMMAGEFCVVERGEGWEPLGQVSLPENGLLAIVPLGTFQVLALDPGVLEQGVLVELEEGDQEEGEACVNLRYGRRHLYFGRNIRVNFNRD